MNTGLQTMTTIHDNLQAALMQQGIDALLPAQVTPEQFTRTAATALVKDSSLQSADKQSLILALTQCARDGLMPDGREAALVVRSSKVNGQYINTVAYMPMVGGVIKRAREAGVNIVYKPVFSQDEFEYVINENGEHLTHRPAFADNDTLVKVYALAKLAGGEVVIEVMSRREVERVRDLTNNGKVNSVWSKWFDRMALKTVVHRLARRLPNASDLFSLLEAGNVMSDTEKTVTTPLTANKRMSLRDALMQKAGQKLPEPEKARDVVTEVTPEPGSDFSASDEGEKPESEPPSPLLESLLNALDDTTEPDNLSEIVQHCTDVSAKLTEAGKQRLRDKIRETKARLMPKHTATIVPFADSNKSSWRFPDGSIEYTFAAAEKKAEVLGMKLQKRAKYRVTN